MESLVSNQNGPNEKRPKYHLYLLIETWRRMRLTLTSNGFTVHWAVWTESRRTLERLIEHGLAINVFRASTSLVRYTWKYPWILRLLSDVCGIKRNPQSRKLHTIDRMLICKAQYFDFAPLALAARLGHIKVATWLLDRGAPIDDIAVRLCECNSELYPESKPRRIRMQRVDALQQSTAAGWTALHLAIEHGHINMVQLLIARGADSLRMFSGGPCTALHCAAVHEKYDIMYYLVLEDLVDINSRGHRNMSIAHMVYSMDNEVLLDHALRLGADINLEFHDYGVWNLFNMACKKEDIASAVRMLKIGAKPNFNNFPPGLRYSATACIIMKVHRQYDLTQVQAFNEAGDERWIRALEEIDSCPSPPPQLPTAWDGFGF